MYGLYRYVSVAIYIMKGYRDERQGNIMGLWRRNYL